MKDDREMDVAISANTGVLRDAIIKALSSLTPRERVVIDQLYGLGLTGKDQYGIDGTLENVGESMKVTRERVRQIEGKALRKLQSAVHPLRSALLRILAEDGGDPFTSEQLFADETDESEEPYLPFGNDASNPYFNSPIAQMGLSVRLTNDLEKMGILFARDLLKMSDADLVQIPNVGEIKIKEIDQQLSIIGLKRANPKKARS
jgi:hypothetical protein